MLKPTHWTDEEFKEFKERIKRRKTVRSKVKKTIKESPGYVIHKTGWAMYCYKPEVFERYKQFCARKRK
jgi:hypothetical protein